MLLSCAEPFTPSDICLDKSLQVCQEDNFVLGVVVIDQLTQTPDVLMFTQGWMASFQSNSTTHPCTRTSRNKSLETSLDIHLHFLLGVFGGQRGTRRWLHFSHYYLGCLPTKHRCPASLLRFFAKERNRWWRRLEERPCRAPCRKKETADVKHAVSKLQSQTTLHLPPLPDKTPPNTLYGIQHRPLICLYSFLLK